MKTNMKIGGKGFLLALVLVSVFSMAFAQIFLSKPYTSTGKIITNANFAVYSDSACTQLITVLDVGDIKKGVTTVKTVYVKFLTGFAPESDMGLQWVLTTTDSDVVVAMKNASDLDVAQNTQFGSKYPEGSVTTINQCRIQVTGSVGCVLEAPITFTLTFSMAGWTI